jgi:hypothetical protein
MDITMPTSIKNYIFSCYRDKKLSRNEMLSRNIKKAKYIEQHLKNQKEDIIRQEQGLGRRTSIIVTLNSLSDDEFNSIVQEADKSAAVS